MNVALVISGHMRTFRECFLSQEKHLIELLSPDIFIHTWDKLEANHCDWHKSRPLEEDDVFDIERLYSPKKLSIENQIEYGHGNGDVLNAQKNMAYGIFKSYELMLEFEKETTKKYDLIVRFRPDIMLYKPITEEYKDISGMEVLYYGCNSLGGCEPVPTIEKERKKYHDFRGMDLFSFSTPDTAQYVFGVYREFDNYFNRGQSSKIIDNNTKWRHTPYLDYALDNGVEPIISDTYMLGQEWNIRRL